VTPDRLRALLTQVAAGELAPGEAERQLAWLPVEDIGLAHIDHHRTLRHGYPEVVFGEGKTPEQVLAIAQRIAPRGDGVLITRATHDCAALLARHLPGIEHNPMARTLYLQPVRVATRRTRGPVLIVAAGTSDLPVAEEAAVCAAAMGNSVERLTDVGVAGLHRLLAAREPLQRAAVIIVVAGMEGALPSVVGGLVSVPVIAVPTSVGYGAALEGFAALFGMLTSCASGITVVNIDNGFGAASAASRINLLPPD
jgi:pyridinium-3,5-biscarboxylic acid mononucleotide synthase